MRISDGARGVLNKLNEKFSNMNFLFAEMYDFERGLDPYFHRALEKVPMEERGPNWLAIMWARDPQKQSWNNRKYELILNTTSLYASTVDVHYAYCSIVFSYVSNSMSYLERCERGFFKYVPDGFSVMCDFVPYYEWNAKQNIREGWARSARRYNGYIYRCVQAGTTGNSEPEWTSSGQIQDGTVIWVPEKPEQFKVQFDEVAYSGIEKFSLDSEDTLCKIDIGGRMFLPLMEGEVSGNTGLPVDDDDPSSALDGGHIYPRILYPKGEISISGDFPNYIEYVAPESARQHWRDKLGK